MRERERERERESIKAVTYIYNRFIAFLQMCIKRTFCQKKVQPKDKTKSEERNFRSSSVPPNN